MPSRSNLETGPRGRQLFDLGFFEYDVLAGDRVEFLEFQLVGFAARVFLGDIKEPSIRAAYKLNEDGVSLGHRRTLAQGIRGLEDNAGLAPVKPGSAGAATRAEARFWPGVIACSAWL